MLLVTLVKCSLHLYVYVFLLQTRELCAVALGRMGLFDSAHSPALLQALFSVREEKAVELQFTVGEALSCVAAGPLSTALHSPWDLRHRLWSVSWLYTYSNLLHMLN